MSVLDEDRLPAQATARRGRGVLEGAFVVLDVLAAHDEGLGLSDLSREAELPKATAHRLLEQLAEVGAVQRHGRLYFVGLRLAHLGRAWQPHPRLRDASAAAVRKLATMTGSAVAITVLHEGRVRAVTATRGAVGDLPILKADDHLSSHTAAGRVLLSAAPRQDRPESFSPREWRRMRAEAREHSAVAYDHQEVLPGICCVAAPVPLPGELGVASVSALVVNRTVPAGLPDLVLRAARDIGKALAH